MHKLIAKRKHQRGLTLLEVLLSLMVMAALLVGVVKLLQRYSDDVKTSITAQHFAAVGDAATAYIKDNYATVVAAATTTTPAVVTVSMLINTGYLPSGFSATNNYQQTVCVLVLEPSTNVLNGLVIGQDGTTIDDVTLGNIAATVGAAGGGVYSTATTTMRGAMGGWAVAATDFKANCSGSTVTQAAKVGHPVMALWFSNGDLASGYLHRNAVTGHTELATMNTPIIMASTQTVGATCTTTAAIAADSAGAVLSCQSGTWASQGSSYWKNPVTTYTTLPACSSSIAWQTRVVETPTTGTGPRAYTCNGSSWVALAVNDAGALTVAGTLTVGGSETIAGALTANSTATVAGALTANSTATIAGALRANSTATVGGRTTTAGVTSSAYMNVNADDWALLGRTSSGSDNATAQNTVGSIYVNDAYFRSVGKWASLIGADSGTMCGYKTGSGGSMGPNCMGYNPAAGCPSGYTQNYWVVSFGNGQLWFCSKN
jgi:type II secretory pathway pseudopilin PulG